jgi:hypothetical protein
LPTDESSVATIEHHLGDSLGPLCPGKILSSDAEECPDTDQKKEHVQDRQAQDVQGSAAHDGNEITVTVSAQKRPSSVIDMFQPISSGLNLQINKVGKKVDRGGPKTQVERLRLWESRLLENIRR